MAKSVRIENVILAYPHLWEKHAPPGTEQFAYRAEFILDPVKNRAACEAVEQAFHEVATEAGKGDKLQFLKSPLQDGDALNEMAQRKGKNPREEIAGKKVIRAADRNYAPAVVNRNVQPLSEANADQIFGGCVVHGFVDLYWSKNPTNPGVYVGLRGVQLVDNVNVERLSGGGMSAEQMFEKIDGPEPQQAGGGAGPAPDWM